MRWEETDRADPRCRKLADDHYTRQTPGATQWARPGFTQVLWTTDDTRDRRGALRTAVFCWWRPKWESGIIGTERKDGLRAIECIIFRNCTGFLSSELVREATAAVLAWEHAQDVAWPDGLITGVGTAATAARRSKRSRPGECFWQAGWATFEHAIGRADVWLRCLEWPPSAMAPLQARRGQRELWA